MSDEWMNKLYFGDNLGILRECVADESVDLIYLDPPFNSNATYNVLFKEKSGDASPVQIVAFDDTWHWDIVSEEVFKEVVEEGGKIGILLDSLRQFLGTNDLMAYLTMMAVRLKELHRVLKPTGSIYLHCDPTASHYLKLVLDAIFGAKNFQNEIIWSYRSGGASKRHFSKKHDVLLFYSKCNDYVFNSLAEKAYTKSKNRKAGMVNLGNAMAEFFDDEYGTYHMVNMRDVWDVSIINTMAKERLGYPTQKPEGLLERIIQASSNEGDVVLDPFCGCGTALAVAERLNRKWIGIDLTHLAIALMRHRLEDTFGPQLSDYEVVGDPPDIEGARALAEEDRFKFEWWALGLVDARPAGQQKKGADKGIDGYVFFFDDDSGKAKKLVVQVKSGHVTRSQVGYLKSAMDREKAEVAAFITLEKPTRPMKEEAAAAGFYDPPGLLPQVPRIQILTIAELLDGKSLDYPRIQSGTFRKAPRQTKAKRPVRAAGE